MSGENRIPSHVPFGDIPFDNTPFPMDRIDLIVEAFRQKFGANYDFIDYLHAGTPFDYDGMEIWLEYEQGTTVN